MSRQTWGVNPRWMIARDLPAVLDIDFDSYPDFMDESQLKTKLREKLTVGIVAERGDKVVGFMLYSLRTHSIYCPRLAVHPVFREHGVGRVLLNKLVSKLTPDKRSRLVLHVDEFNTRAHYFLKACGLTCCAVTHRGGECNYTFEKRVGTVHCAATGGNY